jgi:hypothetical protein
VRKVDAPQAGWYPDPESRTQLRWWDGLDWTNIRRAPPRDSELAESRSAAEYQQSLEAGTPLRGAGVGQAPGGMSRADAQQIIAEVRDVARDEVDRAAELFTQRANAAAREITPLISGYTNRLLNWIRIGLVVASILLIGWFVFQIIAEATFLDWLGDRIDNITDQDGTAGLPAGLPADLPDSVPLRSR